MDGLYFRIKESGCVVFRLNNDANSARLQLEEIATVSLRSGQVRVKQRMTLSPGEETAIKRWKDERLELIRQREECLPDQLIEEMNLLTSWVESSADPSQVAQFRERLFTSVHDLRLAVMRKSNNR